MNYVPAGPVNVNGNWIYDSFTVPGVTIVRDQALRFLYDDSRVLSAVDRNNQTQTKTLYTSRVGTPDGGAHVVAQYASGYSNVFPIQTDGSGIVGIPNGDPNHSNGILGAYDRDGVKHIYRDYSASGCSSSHGCFATDIVDPNGNTITTSLSGWTDTLGRVIPGSFIGPGAVATIPGTSAMTLESDLVPGIAGSDSRCTAGTNASRVLNLPGPPDSTGQATTSSFAFCYADYSYQTAFHAEQISVFWQGIRETSGTAQVLRQIVLPDGSSWLFDYDSYLDLTQITFPTAGYIRYVWVNYSFFEHSQVAPVGRTLAQRISNANDGTGEHIRKYHYVNISSNGTSTTGYEAVSVDEAGNEQVETFDAFLGRVTDIYQGGCGCYNDSSPLGQLNGASSSRGTLLHSVKRTNFFNNQNLPQTIQTVLASGKTSTTSIAYDLESVPLYALDDANFVANNTVPPIYNNPVSFGQQTSISQSDYGAQAGTAGPVLRTISRKYLWSDPSVDPSGNYKASNLIDLLESEFMTDGGGSKIAETDFKYDETTPQNSSITTQHGALAGPVRGNLTTTSRLVSGTSTVSSTATYFDTGMVASRTDQNHNPPTTYQYSSNFAGAYLTQIKFPDTNGVHHVVSAGYDFNTGLQTSFTDQNQQVFTNHYDNMLRVIESDNPDLGKTTFSYPNPNTVIRQTQINSGPPNTLTTVFDGLGRIVQTQANSDPSGVDYVDTAYDGLGRVASVTNPYRSFSESTFGRTSYGYDAQGRTTDVVKADGSVVHTDYSDNVTTFTDEAGHTRRTIVNAFGRITEVDEPGASSALGTPGAVARVSGSIIGHVQMDPAVLSAVLQTINTLLLTGSQSTTTTTTAPAATSTSTSTPNSTAAPNPASPAPPEAITNAPATTTASATANPNYDTGKVWLSIKGFRATALYQQGSTAGSIARDLASQFNVAGSPVFARVNGDSQLILLSRIPGTAGNLTIDDQGTQSDNPSKYPNPSFTISMSPSNWSNAAPGDLSSPLVTLYQYDAQGNLLRVDQKGTAPSDSTQWRTRTFAYDSLSRLLCSANPEIGGNAACPNPDNGAYTSGTIRYSYDNNGNLLQKISPAPNQTGSAAQTISYCYDALNRITGKAYSPQSCPLTSPAVSWSYDSGTNGIGHLTSLTDQAGSGSYSYDPMGRIKVESRTIAGATKNMSYLYNLNGSIQSITYPSTATITYTPDATGRMLSAIDNGHGINYATGATYSPGGRLTSLVSGNSGITNSFSYNQRLQPVTMSAALPTQTLFSLTYDFHFGAGDNGNVFAISNNKDTTRSQIFTYDALNRLTAAQNAGTDCTVQLPDGHTKFWGNNYGYDAWGNLLSKSPTKCTPESMSVTVLANNQLSGYGYDAAGNMTSGHMNSDPTDVITGTYDAENRIATATSTKKTTTTNYTYDADGNRVVKSNGTTGTLYWYMTPGVVAESDLNGNLQSEYIFFNGNRIARKDYPSNAVSYYFSDHLNTTDIVTDAQGNIKSESDFYPWGGELQFVSNDSNHYKFTDKERDAETGLDYFGARYYSNGLARFTSADWSDTPVPVPYADLNNPQTLNIYGYVDNNPASTRDNDGHKMDCKTTTTFKEDGGKATVTTVCTVTPDPDPPAQFPSFWSNFFTNFFTLGIPTDDLDREMKERELLHDVSCALNQTFQCKLDALIDEYSPFMLVGETGEMLPPGLMRMRLLSVAKDADLRNLINDLYKEKSSFQDGGTAAAVEYERATGRPVGGKLHSIKAKEYIKALDSVINSGRLSNADKEIAQKMRDTLQRALTKTK